MFAHRGNPSNRVAISQRRTALSSSTAYLATPLKGQVRSSTTRPPGKSSKYLPENAFDERRTRQQHRRGCPLLYCLAQMLGGSQASGVLLKPVAIAPGLSALDVIPSLAQFLVIPTDCRMQAVLRLP